MPLKDLKRDIPMTHLVKRLFILHNIFK
jgi:hypothetical protein